MKTIYKYQKRFLPKRQKRLMFIRRSVLGFIGVLCIIAVFILALQRNNPTVFAIGSIHPVLKQVSSSAKSPAPYRIVIPTIGIDTAITPLGIKPNGNMAAPSKVNEAGWYKNGPKPGVVGNAVIAGHYSTDNSGVFKRLHELTPGAIVEIHEKENVKRFKVVGKESYKPENAPLSKIFGSASTANLNIITCSGVWRNNSFSERLVVFTELISSSN